EPTSAPNTPERDSQLREPDGGWQGLVFTVGDAPPQIDLSIPGTAEPRGLDALADLPDGNGADLYFDLARKASANILSTNQCIWLGFIGAEYEHFADALSYYAKTSAKRELELVLCLIPFWERRGHWAEAKERLHSALSRYGENASEEKAYALAMHGK